MIINEDKAILHALVSAGRAASTVSRELVEAECVEKADRSPVTVADFAVQAILCRALLAQFPNDAVVAEESSSLLRTRENKALLERVKTVVRTEIPVTHVEEVLEWIDAGKGKPGKRFWTLDPIDGTKGFLRGQQYAVALGLIEDGEPVTGFLLCPNYQLDGERKGVILYARKGKGAFCSDSTGSNWAPVHVSRRIDIQHVRFAESYESGHSDHEGQSRVAHMLGISAPSVRMDSQAKYALIATGAAEIYLRLKNPATPEYVENIWDHAAGAIIVEEAGGKVTDTLGRPLQWMEPQMRNNNGVLVTNGLVHERVVEAVQQLSHHS
ncbi:MAG: 3'(2'),5'-bisphosphate nucleotidase [Chlorobi bacterium]|nr:3'(2'),5'-bisphosphate nucleotidase [Chlorobiota bacterium]